jgi:hypothetical protein
VNDVGSVTVGLILLQFGVEVPAVDPDVSSQSCYSRHIAVNTVSSLLFFTLLYLDKLRLHLLAVLHYFCVGSLQTPSFFVFLHDRVQKFLAFGLLERDKTSK